MMISPFYMFYSKYSFCISPYSMRSFFVILLLLVLVYKKC
ncbi:hypothetical protein B4083_1709 [Bacillus cereus]|nr:hypothetical protein B4083_1709 [Bacillus cereus]